MIYLCVLLNEAETVVQEVMTENFWKLMTVIERLKSRINKSHNITTPVVG